MKQISPEEFQAIIVGQAERENAERAEVGLPPLEVTAHSYGSLTSDSGLTEYFFAGMMIGFVQGGIHYSNGL
ncbi:hypothetical protein EGJ86_19225 [Pseudomonas sp. o96-267]|uniref:hypothetical protein n=1 Tax=Pseudomonas sp. o96-267 TaxID=2479853 RepID=UPI000F76B798|nr:MULTISPECIES: hypothetical protein [Pseudomonas]MDH0959100.1 hypothetical protein [Pseudomonas chengduensis]MDV5863591.1 hypothetical protein [Pseudomonas mendocina]RRV31705.1 hypothetical protein EGJ86_19225 [Pseudomonas sp. o96-267]